MKHWIPTAAAAAVIAAFAAPAHAADMSCAAYTALSDAERIQAVEVLEPKSVEEKVTPGTDSTKGSSGKAGTVDPSMTEAEKALAVAEACDANPNMSAGQAMTVAFPK